MVDADALPDDLLCPITGELFRDPVLLSGDGQTYERSAVEKWLETHDTSPISGAKLETAMEKTLIPNFRARGQADAARGGRGPAGLTRKNSMGGREESSGPGAPSAEEAPSHDLPSTRDPTVAPVPVNPPRRLQIARNRTSDVDATADNPHLDRWLEAQANATSSAAEAPASGSDPSPAPPPPRARPRELRPGDVSVLRSLGVLRQPARVRVHDQPSVRDAHLVRVFGQLRRVAGDAGDVDGDARVATVRAVQEREMRREGGAVVGAEDHRIVRAELGRFPHERAGVGGVSISHGRHGEADSASARAAHGRVERRRRVGHRGARRVRSDRAVVGSTSRDVE